MVSPPPNVTFPEVMNIISDIFTIVASGIAIYLFIFKRKSISTTIKLLLNYSSQITLSELRAKIDRLNNFNSNEPSDKTEIICLLNEIIGQIKGNKILKNKYSDILKKITQYTNQPEKLDEPKKRSITAELRERLRNLDIKGIDELLGG